MNDTTQPEKLPLTSLDIAAEKRDELRRSLAATFPEIMAEDKIDLDQLKRVLGDWVEPDRERFGLNWPGKAACMKVIQAPSVGTLKPCPDESVDWDTTQNVFIEGDNLEVLKLLQKAYFSKIKMIYIDPPYNTGKEFIYPDKYSETLDTYLEYTGQKDNEGRKFSTNTDSSGRFHSRWLNMMYPRLYLAKNLLVNNGMIFISIDDNEHKNLRHLCDEIFGEENFVDCMVWKKRYGGGAKEKYLVTIHEYVLVYAKDLSSIDEMYIPLSDKAIERYYKNKDEHFEKRGPYRTHPLEAMKSFDARENLVFPIPAPDGTKVMPKRQWRWGPQRVEQALQQGEIDFSKDKDGHWVLSSKQYLNDPDGDVRKTKMMSIIDEIYSQHGTSEIYKIFGNAKIFDFPKPSEFVRSLVNVGTSAESEDIVLDFFAGSGTTAHAVFAQNAFDGGNRKFILIQLPEPCDESTEAAQAGFISLASICRERIKRAPDFIAKDPLNQNQDFGFKQFQLTSSSFKEWPSEAQDINDKTLLDRLSDHTNHLKHNLGTQQVLFEMLIKDGFKLTTEIAMIELAGKKVFSVAGGALLICLDKQLTQEVIDAMADMEPSRVICLDAGFQGNDQLKANAVQTFKARARNRETAIEFRTV